MFRAFVTAGAVGAAILGTWAPWHGPTGAPRYASTADLPERVIGTGYSDHLPFGSPAGKIWCGDHSGLAVLIQPEAVWVGAAKGEALRPPLRIPRDGHEWERVESVLRAMRREDGGPDVEIAVDDSASYQDLLVAMLTLRELGQWMHLVTPGLPVYPHHGHGGGLTFDEPQTR